nr:D-xylose ABC transporter substrate-binding protein [Thermoflavimicrobium dichotomicum]
MHKWLRRLKMGMLAITVGTLMTGCKILITGQEVAKQAKKKDNQILIGFSMDTLREERWQKDKAIFEQKVKELGGDVKTLSANGDDNLQLSQAEQLISQGVDVLVVNPHNSKTTAAIVNKAHKEGIPVIAYDRLIMNADVDLYVTFDNVKVGELQAKAVVDHMAKESKGNMVYLGGADTDNNAKLFREGAMKVLKAEESKGKIKIVYDQYTKDWKPEEAMKNMENALTANKNNVQGVVAANDGVAGGAIQALSAQGLVGKVPVSGQDADLAACQRIAEGKQTMTVYKPIKSIASKAAELAVALAKGEKIEVKNKVHNGKINVPSVFLEPVVVTKDNLVQTVIRDGFHRMEEVYKNVPKDQWPK